MADLAKRDTQAQFDALAIGERWLIALAPGGSLPVGQAFPWRGKWLLCDMRVGQAFDCIRVTEPAPVAAQPLLADAPPVEPILLTSEMDYKTKQVQAKAQGYLGDMCSACGEFKLKQAGHCAVCDACGTTTGCS